MRTIKFRAWHKDTQKVIYIVNLLSFSGDGSIWVNENNQHPINTFHGWTGKDFELMQYTGLKDKNGVEIYEGDMVEYATYETVGIKRVEYASVIFVDGCFMFKVYDKTDSYYAKIVEDDEKDWCEVIGNIWENPELLEA